MPCELRRQRREIACLHSALPLAAVLIRLTILGFPLVAIEAAEDERDGHVSLLTIMTPMTM
jgi:hypothetical protein